MAAVTYLTGTGTVAPAFPPRRGTAAPGAPGRRGATPRRRPARSTYLRRRFAVVGLALGLVVVAAQAGAALGGSPLAAPERRPTSASATVQAVVVRPGDSLWSIAERVAPGEDPRPVVDEVEQARGGAPLVPGETILWPR